MGVTVLNLLWIRKGEGSLWGFVVCLGYVWGEMRECESSCCIMSGDCKEGERGTIGGFYIYMGT